MPGKGGTLRKIAVTVNGVRHDREVEPRQLLVYFLREDLDLTGTNVGCDSSSCGSCTVMLNGRSVKSCTLLAVQADGMEVTTIEGLGNGQMHPLQESFYKNHGLQCGYCTPGMIMAALGLIESGASMEEEDIRLGLEGNLCRCTGYQNIVESIKEAAGHMRSTAKA
jgi:aerobic-type carbon monoxide dehydrogenase small subunit (CoxS/CutS family)